MDENLRTRVVEILQDEQKQLEGCLENQSDIVAPQTIVKTQVTQNSDGSWNKVEYEEKTNFTDGSIDNLLREKVQKNSDSLQQFCKQIDDKILSINAQINSKKQEIVVLSTEASDGNCWPGIAHSLGSSTAITVFYGRNTYLREDLENLRIYPYMAGPSARYDVENPFEPDSIYKLTPIYSGYGYKNLPDKVVYKNKDGSITGLLTDGSAAYIGKGRFDISDQESDHQERIVSIFPYRYYDGAGNSPNAKNTSVTPSRCVAIANSISVLYDEIIELRKERDSLRGNLNIIKDNKSEKELSAWGLNRTKDQIEKRSSKNISVISSILSYDSSFNVINENIVLNLDVASPDSYTGIGTNWFDLSGNGNNAVLYPISSPASYDYSDNGLLTFNGVDQYAQTKIKTSNILGDGNVWAIETWFNISGPPLKSFNTVVSAAGTITAVYDIITGISTNNIKVGQYIQPISEVIDEETVVTQIGIGSVYINPPSINSDNISTSFNFGNYTQYANTIVDVNASSTTTHMLSVSYGQSGIFAGISTNKLIYTTSQTGVSTTHLIGSEVSIGSWNQAFIVRNSTTNTTLYLNGNKVATYNGNFPLGTASTTSTKIASWTEETSFSNLSVSLVKIYNKSFTDEEVKVKFEDLKYRYNIVG